MSPNERSKKLSYILRHAPEKVGLTLDKQGWASVADLTSLTDFSHLELKGIVESDEKGRYSFSDDMAFIRANQGHSTPTVKLSFKVQVPPVRLFHGTTEEVANNIMRSGLLKMNRHHVHLAEDFHTAWTVGSRRKKSVVVFEVDAAKMLADNFTFYKSENGVWLTDSVPPKYLTEL